MVGNSVLEGGGSGKEEEKEWVLLSAGRKNEGRDEESKRGRQADRQSDDTGNKFSFEARIKCFHPEATERQEGHQGRKGMDGSKAPLYFFYS